MNVILILISSLAFVFYGLLCLFTDHMKAEFERYGLPKWRKLTGILETLGGIGLIVGMWVSPILYLSAAGLALLMFFGMIVRFKTQDPIIQIMPAFILMIINLVILLDS